ncbi:integrase [Bradyrhizobium sp. LM6.11]
MVFPFLPHRARLISPGRYWRAFCPLRKTAASLPATPVSAVVGSMSQTAETRSGPSRTSPQSCQSAPPRSSWRWVLALWSGQRQGDLLRLPWSAYESPYIRLRQSKGGRRVAMPAGGPLRALLDTTESRGPLILTNTLGRPWTSDGFRTSWAKACERAGIEGLTFHDLRGTAVVRLAIAGASVPQIAAVTGHSLKDVEAILDAHYLGRDIQLAEAAVLKLEARTKL